MTSWKNKNTANSAPKFVTDAATGETGVQEFGSELIYVTGKEGYPVSPGWVRRLQRGSRHLYESVVAIGNPIVQQNLQIVGSRGEINALEGGAITTSNQKHVGRSRNYIGTQDVTELRVGFNGFFVDSATSGNNYTCVETNASNSYILRVALEINGVTKQLTFDGGSTETVIASGTTLKMTDPILPSEFGLEVFPAQQEIWIRAEREFSVGQKAMFYQAASNSPAIAGETYYVGPTTATSRLLDTGPLSTTGGWAIQAHVWLPYAIIGRPVKKMMAAMTVGASIENGVGDGQGDGINGAGGYMRRMLANVNGKKVARIHLAKSGETAKSFLSNCSKRLYMLQYVNHVFSGHGGNDYSTGETLANTQDRWLQIWALLKAQGAWVEHYALSVKSDSTDAWATIANQTPRTGYETGGAWRDAGNAWCAAQVGVNPNLNAFVDLSDAQSDATRKDLWRVDLGQPTIDGTHPSAVIADAMAVLASSHIETLRQNWEV